jgi:hypothetical protein
MYIGLHMKYPLYLSDFKDTGVFSINILKIFKYHISYGKTVQREPSYSMRKDRHFCNFGMRLKSTYINYWYFTFYNNIVFNYRKNIHVIIVILGPGSSVGIATGYKLEGPGIEFRWGKRFSAPVQTGPGAHPAFCTGSFPGAESGRGVTLKPHPLLVPRSKSRVQVYLYSP